jgi:hypothetical protein
MKAKKPELKVTFPGLKDTIESLESKMLHNKNVPHGTENEIIIPELEEAMEKGGVRGSGIPCWTDEEIAILKKYYGYVSKELILKYLPQHNMDAIRSKAARINVTCRGGRKK